MNNTLYSFAGFVFLLLLPVSGWSQNPVPNGGFENWSGTTLVGWTHNGSVPPLDVVVKTSDAYSGLSAVKGEVKGLAGFPFPPTLFPGSQQNPLFAVSENHHTFSGYYKFQPQGGDMLFIEVVLTNLATGGAAEGHAMIATATSSYTQFNITLVYDPSNPPNFRATTANITIAIQPPTGQAPTIGTNFVIDHLTFDGYPVGVEERADGVIPEHFSLEQNYPNPFNPSTEINFGISEQSFVRLSVYNLLGEEVATLVNETMQPGSYVATWNADGISSGMYLYSLNTGNSVLTRRMMLVR